MFDESLADPANEVIACVDHKPELTIAKRSDNSLILAKDAHGVFASCWLPASPLGDSVLEGVAAGKIWGCSCGWEDGETQTRSDGVVEWITGKLFDVTVVMNGEPAYKTTEVHLRTNNYLNSLLARLNYVNFKIKSLNKNITTQE
jgi:HK97 family phage prohead protease